MITNKKHIAILIHNIERMEQNLSDITDKLEEERQHADGLAEALREVSNKWEKGHSGCAYCNRVSNFHVSGCVVSKALATHKESRK